MARTSVRRGMRQLIERETAAGLLGHLLSRLMMPCMSQYKLRPFRLLSQVWISHVCLSTASVNQVCSSLTFTGPSGHPHLGWSRIQGLKKAPKTWPRNLEKQCQCLGFIGQKLLKYLSYKTHTEYMLSGTSRPLFSAWHCVFAFSRLGSPEQ